jgi:AcrR family transcriptional regulator
MVYRRTERVLRRQERRHGAILAAARAVAAEGGMAAVQIAPVAERAGIAAGTVYRYFPAKTELVSELITAVAEAELEALRRAADAAPGPLSALTAAITTLVARALGRRRLVLAVMTEPVDADIERVRLIHRKAMVAELEARVRRAIAAGQLPPVDAALAAPALLGALLDGTVGPLAPEGSDAPGAAREAVQTLGLFALRALGLADAHARGLIVQAPIPEIEFDALD